MNVGNLVWPIHREGFKFIGIGVGAAICFWPLSHALFCFFLILSLLIGLFFRNPNRVVPTDSNLIVSPVDGFVSEIIQDVPPSEFDLGSERRYKISIFLSLLNVHINRSPASGKIKKILYSPGQFLNASLNKSSVFNEKNTIVLALNGQEDNLMSFSQIAGALARRIICDVHEGQEIKKGEVFGLIRFGSRCDVWLPIGTVPQVIVGQTMVSGESILCDTSEKGVLPRSGELTQ